MKKKDYLIIVSLFVLLIGIIAYNNKITNDAVEECVKEGNTYNYCFEKLS